MRRRWSRRPPPTGVGDGLPDVVYLDTPTSEDGAGGATVVLGAGDRKPQGLVCSTPITDHAEPPGDSVARETATNAALTAKDRTKIQRTTMRPGSVTASASASLL